MSSNDMFKYTCLRQVVRSPANFIMSEYDLCLYKLSIIPVQITACVSPPSIIVYCRPSVLKICTIYLNFLSMCFRCVVFHQFFKDLFISQLISPFTLCIPHNHVSKLPGFLSDRSGFRAIKH